MTPPRTTRHIRGDVCPYTHKLRYASPEAAEKRRAMIKRTRGEALSVIRCWFCRGWHLGHDDIGRRPSDRKNDAKFSRTRRGGR